MGLRALIERLASRVPDTSHAADGSGQVAGQVASALGGTLDTCETSQVEISHPANDPSVQHPGTAHQSTLGAPDARHNAPSALAKDWHQAGHVWGEVETQEYLQRVELFALLGLTEPKAERLGEVLLKRDRQGDDRHHCVECRHCRPGQCCQKGLAVPDVLWRCDELELDPATGGFRP